jgi:hypothetical protein
MKSGASTLCILTLSILAAVLNMTAHEHKSRSSESPSVGPQIGSKAPSLAARDQFGHEQTNETLKGTNGTVLLFFRSADW